MSDTVLQDAEKAENKARTLLAEANMPVRHVEFLFALQASGQTNMFGAASYLKERFGLGHAAAIRELAFWMQHYDELEPLKPRDVDVEEYEADNDLSE